MTTLVSVSSSWNVTEGVVTEACNRCKKALKPERRTIKNKSYCAECSEVVEIQAERDRARSRHDDAPGTPWD